MIQLQDSNGNPVSQSGVSVLATIASGGGTLGGTSTAVTDASGAATFTDLSISGLLGNRTLQFSATGSTPVVSDPIALTPGPADAAQTTATVPDGTAGSPTVITVDGDRGEQRDAAGDGQQRRHLHGAVYAHRGG